MNTNWKPRTIFMDMREVSLVAVRRTPPKPNRRSGGRLFRAIKVRLARLISCHLSSQERETPLK
jgi:hypothetical protein